MAALIEHVVIHELVSKRVLPSKFISFLDHRLGYPSNTSHNLSITLIVETGSTLTSTHKICIFEMACIFLPPHRIDYIKTTKSGRGLRMNPQARNKATTLRWTQLGNTTAIKAKLYECECESVGGQRILVHFS